MVLGALLTFTIHPASAVELAPVCHQFYDQFKTSVTYEEAGQLADMMLSNSCWPALQGLLDDQPESTTLPALADCQTLGVHIVDWVKRDLAESDPGWVILKLYEEQPLTLDFCYELGVGTYQVPEGFKDSCHALGDIWYGSTLIGDERHGGVLIPQTPSNKVINCIARARLQSGNRAINYWLERDPDGQEWYGYVYP